jgi:hypothetical protein
VEALAASDRPNFGGWLSDGWLKGEREMWAAAVVMI